MRNFFIFLFALALPVAEGQSLPEPKFNFSCEQEWVADQIARDIGEIIFFASKNEALPTEQLSVKLTANPAGQTLIHTVVNSSAGRLEMDLELKHHLWSTETYLPLATALLKLWHPALPPEVSVDPALLNA